MGMDRCTILLTFNLYGVHAYTVALRLERASYWLLCA